MTARHWKTAQDFIAKLAAKPRFGLFSDLDGTLSPIALTPDTAAISPRIRELLLALQENLPLLALISGRRANSLRERVGIDGITYIGNHGLERWVDGRVEIIPEVESYRKALEAVKAELQQMDEPGVYVEDKEVVLSLHYRQAAEPVAFARNIATLIAGIVERHGMTLFTGKMVFEVRPPVDVDKGVALQRLIAENSIEAALFLGDDVSDLNALKMARKLRDQGTCDIWGIGVQSLDAPEALAATADFLATGVDDVEDLLACVLKARRASST